MSDKILISAEEASDLSSNNLNQEVKKELERISGIIKERALKGYVTARPEVPRHLREIICKELKKAGYSYNYVDIYNSIEIKW